MYMYINIFSIVIYTGTKSDTLFNSENMSNCLYKEKHMYNLIPDILSFTVQ